MDDILSKVEAITGSKFAKPKTPSNEDEAMAGAIRKGAEALGISPEDYATAISYESAGTFDPFVKGPVTKWGQHRGTIQYGEPQQKQYGVTPNQTFEDQVTRSNVEYLRNAGVKPGMGFNEIYAAINGGSVRKNLKTPDANTGRTIADNIRLAEKDHRGKVRARFGQYFDAGDPTLEAVKRILETPDTPQETPVVETPRPLAPNVTHGDVLNALNKINGTGTVSGTSTPTPVTDAVRRGLANRDPYNGNKGGVSVAGPDEDVPNGNDFKTKEVNVRELDPYKDVVYTQDVDENLSPEDKIRTALKATGKFTDAQINEHIRRQKVRGTLGSLAKSKGVAITRGNILELENPDWTPAQVTEQARMNAIQEIFEQPDEGKPAILDPKQAVEMFGTIGASIGQGAAGLRARTMRALGGLLGVSPGQALLGIPEKKRLQNQAANNLTQWADEKAKENEEQEAALRTETGLTGDVIGTVAGMPSDLARMTIVGGGNPFVGMVSDSMLQSAGRGERGTKFQKEAAKATAYAILAKFAPVGGQMLANRTSVAVGRVGALAGTAGATAGIEALSGAKREDIIRNTLINTMMSGIDLGAIKKKAVIGVKDVVANERMATVEIDLEAQTVKPVPDTTPVDIEAVATAKEAKPPTPTQRAITLAKKFKERRDTAEREANTDPLTGLANRRALDKALPSAEKDANTSIISFDANDFGKVNKELGEEAGDKALKEIADSLTKAGGRVFRKGGDEFVVIAPKDKAQAIRDKAEELFGTRQYGSTKVSISGTIGDTFASANEGLQAAKAAKKADMAFAKRPDGTLKTKNEYTSDEWANYTRSVIDTKLAEAKKAEPQKPVEPQKAEVAPQTPPEFFREKIGDKWYVSQRPVKRYDEAGSVRITKKRYEALEKEYNESPAGKAYAEHIAKVREGMRPIAPQASVKSVPAIAAKKVTIEPPPTKLSKVGKSIEAKAIEKGLTESFEGTAEYTPVTIKEQARKASELVNTDIEGAKRILLGDEKLPDGLRAAPLIDAVERYAQKNGDVELLRDLANSPLTAETSLHAQELRLLRERNPNSPIALIQQVQKAREGKVGRRVKDVKAETAKMVGEIKKEIERATPRKPKVWADFVDSLKC